MRLSATKVSAIHPSGNTTSTPISATPTPSLPACGGLSSSSGAPAHNAHKARRGCHRERLIPSPTPHRQRPTAASYWASAEVQVLTARVHGPPYPASHCALSHENSMATKPFLIQQKLYLQDRVKLDSLAYPTRGKG